MTFEFQADITLEVRLTIHHAESEEDARAQLMEVVQLLNIPDVETAYLSIANVTVNECFDQTESDDPQCTNCGVYRSEHALLRASDCDGFSTEPGGSVVYTSSYLAEMSPDEIDELFGRDDDRDREPDDDEYQCGECDTIWKKEEGYECPGCNVTVV